MNKDKKILLPGGAGLVGQNLVAQLKTRGYHNLVVIDKHKVNLKTLSDMHPQITTLCADLAEPGPWEKFFDGADVVVMLQAQIGDPKVEPFIRNNINSTENIIQVIKKYNIPYTVHISSSVVNSMANDHYTNTKKSQEALVLESKIPAVVLRPTLMFGWFDRKHLGWLARFMKKMPLFPIPGNGKYMRQPLYAGDFASIIISCIEDPIFGQIYNITGLERVNYIDIIREIKRSTSAKAVLLKIPYLLFYWLLIVWGVFDKNPPFTAPQLKALVSPDEFEVIDWPGIFKVEATPFAQAVHETFHHPEYSKVVLEF